MNNNQCNSCLAMFDGFSALIWRLGLDNKCNYFNKRWLEFTGRSLQQELGDGWLEGVHPEDIQWCSQAYLEGVNKQPFTREYRLRCVTGEYRWIIDSGGPLFDAHNQFAGYIGYCYDITQRKKTEKINTQYHSLFYNARDMILLIDHDGRIIRANDSALEVYGYKKDELEGMNFRELLLSDDSSNIVTTQKNYIRKTDRWYLPEGFDIVEEQFKQAIIHGNAYEVVHRRKDGTVLPIELNITPSIIDDEQVLFIVIRDITSRRQVEEEKLHLTGEIARSEKKASLVTVAAGIAHEVNNPLTYIKMNAQLLELMIERQYRQEDAIEISVASYKRSVDAIVRGTERIADIVSGLKFFARQELREKTKVNLYKSIEDAWTLVKTNEELLGTVELQSTVSSDIMVYANSQQIEQILINLLNNALKAIAKSGQVHGQITINADQQDHETEWVVLKVIDNGCGMEKGAINRIFEPFYTSDNEKGTGMGLAVVQGIIDEHGGIITVESVLGQGTTFTIKLPTYLVAGR